MNLRPWVAAPLVGAAIALVAPAADVAAQTSAQHASGPLWLHEGDDHHGHRNPWRHCHSRRRVVLIDKGLRAILTNGRRGPEVLVLQGSSSSSIWPTAPWDTWSVATYLDVNYPTQTDNQYEFRIRGFFRVHPLFEVKAFDRHERVFRFPATHCADDEGDGDRRDRARPHGGRRADGSGSSGSVSPRKGDNRENGRGGQGAPATKGAVPAPLDSVAAACGVGLLSVKHILIAAGGLLMILGMLATVWLRRRRPAA